MKQLVSLTMGLVFLSACGSMNSGYPKQVTISEVMTRCTSDFCRVFNSTQAGSQSLKARYVTIFVPQDNYFSAYLKARGIPLERLLGTAEGEALIKAHITLQTVPFPVPQGGTTLQALDGRPLEIKAENTSGTAYSVAGVLVPPATDSTSDIITDGRLITILGVIQ